MKDKIISVFSNSTAETKQEARSADLRPANPARQILPGKPCSAKCARQIMPSTFCLEIPFFFHDASLVT
jgi:hypothetical protein